MCWGIDLISMSPCSTGPKVPPSTYTLPQITPSELFGCPPPLLNSLWITQITDLRPARSLCASSPLRVQFAPLHSALCVSSIWGEMLLYTEELPVCRNGDTGTNYGHCGTLIAVCWQWIILQDGTGESSRLRYGQFRWPRGSWESKALGDHLIREPPLQCCKLYCFALQMW